MLQFSLAARSSLDSLFSSTLYRRPDFLLLHTLLAISLSVSLHYCSIQDEDFSSELYMGQNDRYSRRLLP